jgi:hypothetical protein
MREQRYNLNLTEKQYEWLRQKAFDERRTMAEIIREMVDKAMKEQKAR